MLHEDELEVQDQVVQFKGTLYDEIEDWKPMVNGLDFSSIDENDRLLLDK